ncbi:MAG: hypothetical protein P1P90_01310 [Patescibacteria group bacterium]|nr:hypothetical protein [Patescibacteria group bacterium]
MNTNESQKFNVKSLTSVIFLVLLFGAGCNQSSNGESQVTNIDSVVVAIEEVFADNYKTGVNDVKVEINEDEGDFVRGYVSMPGVDKNDFMAFKADDEWSVIYDPEQKPYECDLLRQYNFPEDMMGNCKPADAEFTIADARDIQMAFADIYHKNIEDITVKVDKYDATHARGSVQFAGEQGGGMFLAVKDQGAWDVVVDGNGTYECEAIDVYEFPEDMITDCIK